MTIINQAPPKDIPSDFYDDFTLSNKIPVIYQYFNGTGNKDKYYTLQDYEKIIKNLSENNFTYYGKTINYLLDTINHFPIVDKSILIFGSDGINCDAIAIWKGAKSITIVDYNLPQSEHKLVSCMTHEEIFKNNIKFDIGISISSFEHDGLGRYGDTINPVGDLLAMSYAKKVIKKNGKLFLSVPIGTDCIAWNAHRIYGRIRLPLLIKKWKIIYTSGFTKTDFERKIGTFTQPVFTLENI